MPGKTLASPDSWFVPIAEDARSLFVSVKKREAHELLASAVQFEDAPRANDDSIFRHLTCGNYALGATLFAGVVETPVGYTVTVKDGVATFSPGHVVAEERDVDVETAVREIRSRAYRSVARCVDGAKHVGVLTSGGMDSSWLACIASKLKGSGAKLTLIASYFGDVGDDRPYLAELERHLSAHVVRMRPGDAGRYVIDSMVRDAQPGLWISEATIPAAMKVVEREGIDVLLHGIPGDTLFDGDPRFASYAWRKGRYREALSWSATYRSIYYGTRWGAVMGSLVRPLVVPPLKDFEWVRMFLRHRRTIPPWVGEKLREFLRVVEPEDARTPYDMSATERLLPVGDSSNRTSSWSTDAYQKLGVRVLSPYANYELASFVAGLDPKLLSAGGEYRGLFRHVLQGEVPLAIASRRSKSYFEEEHEEIFRSADVRALLEYARPEKLASAGWVEAKSFEDACTRAISSGRDWSRFYPYLCVEKWMREWGIA